MKNNRTYEVNFDNGFTEILGFLSDARKNVIKNAYNAKVTSIISIYIDKNSNLKKNYIKF